MDLQTRVRISADWGLALGVWYGFPTCCADAFSSNCCWETKEVFPQGPWTGTGFIPCLTCARLIGLNQLNFERFVQQRIAPKRIDPSPFPVESDKPMRHADLVAHIYQQYKRNQGVGDVEA